MFVRGITLSLAALFAFGVMAEAAHADNDRKKQPRIIIEDDIEMSPFWFTWLKKAWAHYKDRDDIFGIALQVLLAMNFLGTWEIFYYGFCMC